MGSGCQTSIVAYQTSKVVPHLSPLHMGTVQERHHVKEALEDCVNDLVKQRPDDPFRFLADEILTKHSPAPKIEKLVGREVLDGSGRPAVQVDVYCVIKGRSMMVARGTSCGAPLSDIRDTEDHQHQYHRDGVARAVHNVNVALCGALASSNPINLASADKQMCQTDGTATKSKLGGNAIVASSLAVAAAGAIVRDVPAYLHLAGVFFGRSLPTLSVPVPMVTVLSRGSKSSLHCSEVLIVGRKDMACDETVHALSCVYKAVEAALQAKFESFNSTTQTAAGVGSGGGGGGDVGGVTDGHGHGQRPTWSGGLGRFGGHTPGYGCELESIDAAVCLVEDAIQSCGMDPGTDVSIAIVGGDVYDPSTKHYTPAEGMSRSADGMLDYYVKLIDSHPAISVLIDALAGTDTEVASKLVARLGDRVTVVGHEMFKSQTREIQKAIDGLRIGGAVIDVGQAGTVTEAMEAARAVFAAGHVVVFDCATAPSSDTIVVDIAVGIGAGYVKIGGLRGSERVGKAVRLVQIAELVDDANK